MSESSPEPTVRIARLVPVTDAEGPGTRAALWVGGCSLRCDGCFNPQLWSPTSGVERPIGEVLAELVASPAIEGVTFLGGEPFEQAEALAVLAEAVRERGLSVMVFSGYTLAELREQAAASASGVARLLGATDLLVDGRFESDRLDLARPWVGSTNQGFHALTPRYADLIDSLAELPDRLEVTVTADGSLSVNGWSDTAMLEAVLDGVGRRPSRRIDH